MPSVTITSLCEKIIEMLNIKLINDTSLHDSTLYDNSLVNSMNYDEIPTYKKFIKQFDSVFNFIWSIRENEKKNRKNKKFWNHLN